MITFSTHEINRFWMFLGVVWMMITIGLSLTSSSRIIGFVDSIRYGEQMAHALSYSALMFCFLMAFKGQVPVIPVGAFCILVGVLVEIAQGLSSYRDFEFKDILFNVIGTGVGYLAYVMIKRNRLLSA